MDDKRHEPVRDAYFSTQNRENSPEESENRARALTKKCVYRILFYTFFLLVIMITRRLRAAVAQPAKNVILTSLKGDA